MPCLAPDLNVHVFLGICGIARHQSPHNSSAIQLASEPMPILLVWIGCRTSARAPGRRRTGRRLFCGTAGIPPKFLHLRYGPRSGEERVFERHKHSSKKLISHQHNTISQMFDTIIVSSPPYGATPNWSVHTVISRLKTIKKTSKSYNSPHLNQQKGRPLFHQTFRKNHPNGKDELQNLIDQNHGMKRKLQLWMHTTHNYNDVESAPGP